jgi:hypothetical protein
MDVHDLLLPSLTITILAWFRTDSSCSVCICVCDSGPWFTSVILVAVMCVIKIATSLWSRIEHLMLCVFDSDFDLCVWCIYTWCKYLMFIYV